MVSELYFNKACLKKKKTILEKEFVIFCRDS